MTPRLIAIDWGTTSFRAALADADGRAITRTKHPDGILAANGRFAQVLATAIAPLRREHGDLPIVMCGMIGSRQGWREAPYVHAPATLADVAAHLLTFETEGAGLVSITPGIDIRSPGGVPDVMRGEETQIFGACAALGIDTGTFVHPGTHAKWIRVEGGRIVSFETYMTGEVYGVLKDHTILGRMMTDAPRSDDAFERGVAAAGSIANAGPGALLHLLFSARTLALFDALKPGEGASYLSGLLIGAEMREAARRYPGDIVIVGSEDLEQRYRMAAGATGIACRTAPADCAVPGLTAVARAAGLLR